MKHAAWLVAVVVVAVLVSAQPIGMAAFQGGSGTPEDPILIGSCLQLQDMNNNLSASYALANDIDCSDTVNWNDGAGFVPIGSYTVAFAGVFDGRGHAITGLFIYRPAAGIMGLFAKNGNVIRNVRLIDVDVTGYGGVGGLAAVNGALIERVSVSGSVSGVFATIGGVVGQNYFGTIRNSYAAVRVDGSTYVGGLVGEAMGGPADGSVRDSYATGKVTGHCAGGLVGANSAGQAPIFNSYATGVVIYVETGYGTPSAIGGLVGCNVNYDGPAFSVFDSYWDVESSELPTGHGGIGKTTTEMHQQATFQNWDFVNVWTIKEGQGYPKLRWETPPDTVPPVVTVPASSVTDATSAAGAVIVYAASALDDVDGTLTPACAPASGSAFPVGATTVTCTATDAHGNTGSASFTITVLAPAQMTANLVTAVTSIGFQQGANLLQAALTELKGGRVTTACNQMGAFTNQVQAQAGKKLSAAQASQLLQAAARVKTVIGCR